MGQNICKLSVKNLYEEYINNSRLNKKTSSSVKKKKKKKIGKKLNRHFTKVDIQIDDKHKKDSQQQKDSHLENAYENHKELPLRIH